MPITKHTHNKIINLCSISGALLFSLLNSCTTMKQSDQWMTQNKSTLLELNLNKVKIPGSYSANSYNIKGTESICLGETNTKNPSSNATIIKMANDTNGPIRTNILNYLNHQNYDINTQLMHGIRFLDLSLCYQDNVFYTSNYYLTEPFIDILNQINKFLNNYPYEVVIIDLDKIWVSHGELTTEEAQQLEKLIKNKLAKHIIPTDSIEHLSFRNIWKEKHNVLIMSSNSKFTDSAIIWNKHKLVELEVKPEFVTIKKLTAIQLGIMDIESNPSNQLNIFPVYTKFNPNINTPEEIVNYTFNIDLIINYLYSLPEENPMNIIVADRYLEKDLVNYSMNQFQINKDNFKKPNKIKDNSDK